MFVHMKRYVDDIYILSFHSSQQLHLLYIPNCNNFYSPQNKNYYNRACPYIVDSTIGVGHITGAGHYVRVLGGKVTFAPNGCKTFTISRMKLNNTYFSISEITNGTYILSDDNTAYIITPIDNTLDVITKWSEIRTDGALTMCFIKSYT